MFWKSAKETITHESSRSGLPSVLVWPSAIKPRTESQAANRCSLPYTDEEGWKTERSRSRNSAQTSEREKQHIHIRPGSWVLVAEDDVILRSLFSDALREKSLHVLSAANGLEALQLYRENADKIWLVITDVMMPAMDGLTAAVEMRKIDKNVYFLFMSGHDPQAIEEAVFSIGDVPDSTFYQKPSAFRDIIDRIRMVPPHPWE